MAELTPWLVQKFYETDGVTPANGHKIFTYESGTTTKKATKVSQDGADNTNPVITNSDGTVNGIWLNAGAYKIVQAPANDTDPPTSPIKTWDKVKFNEGEGSLGIATDVNDLKTFTDGQYDVVIVKGWDAEGDNGTALFRWDATASTGTADDINIIAPTTDGGSDGVGVWERMYSEDYRPANLTALRALPAGFNSGTAGSNSYIELLGHTTAGDGGGGLFYWDSSSTATDNDGTIITPSSAPSTGRWVRMFTGLLSVNCFGVLPNTHASADATANVTGFNNIISALGGNFKLEPGYTYEIDSEIVLTSKSDFVINMNGSTIKMKDATTVATGYSNIKFVTCTDFVVKDGIFDANRANRTPTETSAQTIFLNDSVSRFSFENVQSLNAVVDGWYLASSTPETASTHVSDGQFINCSSDNAYRNGMSIIEGNNLNIIGGRYINTTGTSPQAGIDIESNQGSTPDGANRNIQIIGVESSGNVGYGVQISDNDNPLKITIRDSNISSNTQGAIFAGGIDVTIDNNDFDTYDDNITAAVIETSSTSNTIKGIYITNNRFRNITAGITKFCISNDATTSDYTITGNTFYEVTCKIAELQAANTRYERNNHFGCDAGGLVNLDRDDMICNYNFFDDCALGPLISCVADNSEIIGNRFLRSVNNVISCTGDAENLRVDGNYCEFASTGANKFISMAATFRSLQNNIASGSNAVSTCFTLTGGASTEVIGHKRNNLCIDDTGNERLANNDTVITGTVITGTTSVNSETIIVDAEDNAVFDIKSDNNNDGTFTDGYTRIFVDGGATARWSYGHRQTDSDAFIIAYNSNTLSTNNALRISYSTGAVQPQTFLEKKVTSGITATNPGGQGDSPLTTDINEVSTVANANDAVTMPAAVVGREITIINNGANTLEIWPASGDNLGSGVDTAVTLASGSNVRYLAYDATNWVSV